MLARGKITQRSSSWEIPLAMKGKSLEHILLFCQFFVPSTQWFIDPTIDEIKSSVRHHKKYFNYKTQGFHFPKNETERLQGEIQTLKGSSRVLSWIKIQYHVNWLQKSQETQCASTVNWETYGPFLLLCFPASSHH